MNEQNINEQNEEEIKAPITDEEIERLAKKSRTTKTIIIAIFVAALILVGIYAIVPSFFGETDEEYETYPPVHPSKLHDTKEEGFDIMEYEEYLSLNRNIMYIDGGVRISIDEDDVTEYGEQFRLAYDIIGYLIAGDVDAYNSVVADDLKKESFTQQQLYAISLQKASSNEGESYEHVVRVEYKIHENNGTYINNIEPDAMRYQLYCMERVNGNLKVTAILEPFYKTE